MNPIIDYEYMFPAAEGDTADAIKVTASSELMKNYATGRLLDASGEAAMAAVRDPRGDLAILVGGASGHLFLVRQTAQSPTGWERHDITNAPVGRFDAAQNRDGDVVVYALLGGKLCHGRVTTPAVQWTEVKEYQPRGRVTFLRAGAPRGGTQPLVIVMAEENGRVERYVVNGKRPTRFPNDVAEVFDAAAGQMEIDGELQPGIFALYRTTSDETVIGFVGQGEREYEFLLDAPAGARALATAPSPRNADETDLYVAGSGIWLFDAESMKKTGATPVNIASEVSGITRLDVHADAQGATVWAYAQGAKRLYHSVRAGNRWSPPAPVHTGAIGMTAIRSGEQRADELVVATAGGVLTRGWLDPRAKLWMDTDVPITDDGVLQTFDSYSTVLHVEDGKGRPLTGRTFELDSSEWLEATINGQPGALGRAPVKVTSDPLGRITIVSKAATIASSVLTLRPQAGAAVPVDPAKKVRATLRATGEAELRTQFPGAPPEHLSAAATALKNLSTVSRYLPEDGSLQSPDVTRARMTAEEAAPWGLSFDPDGSMRLLTAEEVRALSAGDAAIDFGNLIGDALRFIRNTLDAAVHVMVEAAKAIVRIGNLVINFALESINHVLATMHQVVEKIGATMNKLVSWLGFVFDVEDVLTLHKVMINVTKQTWRFARGRLDSLGKNAERFFDTIEGEIQKISLPAKMGKPELFGSAREASAKYDREGNGTALLTRSPAANIATQHLTRASAALDAAMLAPLSSIEDEVRRRVEKLFPESERKEIERQLTALMKNFGKLMQGESVPLADTLEDLKALLALPVKMLRLVVRIFVEVAKELLAALENALSASLNIPFLSTFYASITKDGRPFTILNALLLLAAFPATAAYKLFAGKAPFPNGQTYGLDTATAEQIFGRTAEDEIDQGTKIYVAAGNFIAPWARMLMRGLGAFLAVSESAFLTVVSVLLLAVLVFTGIPASTPLDTSPPNFFTWAGWGLDAAALLMARLFGGAPKSLLLVIDAVGVLAGFLVGLAGSISRMVAASRPNDVAAEILGACDVFAGLAADGGVVAMAVKDPEVVAIAAATMGAGTQVSTALGVTAAILNVT